MPWADALSEGSQCSRFDVGKVEIWLRPKRFAEWVVRLERTQGLWGSVGLLLMVVWFG